jgi:hypothetical protein
MQVYISETPVIMSVNDCTPKADNLPVFRLTENTVRLCANRNRALFFFRIRMGARRREIKIYF